MEVNERNWNLATWVSEISALNEAKNSWISLLVSELGFNLFSRAWKIFEARSSRSVDSRDSGSTEYMVGQSYLTIADTIFKKYNTTFLMQIDNYEKKS